MTALVSALSDPTLSERVSAPTTDEPAEEASHVSESAGLPRVSAFRVFSRWLVVQAVLFYFGVLRVADLVGLRWLAYAITMRRSQYERLTTPIALRRAFELLGPTYVKLGQLVASGEALFPQHYSEEFRLLLDRVRPFSLEAVNETLDAELGDARARIVRLDPEPIAAASIAQVHGALLDDGSEVVIKVQRPGIGELAAADIALMRFYATWLAKVSVHVRRANALAIIEDFEQNLIEEIDFRNETARMREFNEVMLAMGTKDVSAPLVEDDLSTRRVLTMERFDGWRLDDTAGIQGSRFDGKERLRSGVRAWFQTLILRGWFHGDVHAGNFLLLKDGRIGYLDFGIVGTFDDKQKANVLEYVLGFQSQDFSRVAKSMIEMGTVDPESIDHERFAADLEKAYAPMIDPDESFKMRDMLPGLLRVAQKHRMRMPKTLVLVTKQLVYLDRYTRALGGHDMNVLTDQALSNLIMQDMLAAMFA